MMPVPESDLSDVIDSHARISIAESSGARLRAAVEPERNLLLAVLTDAIVRFETLATTADGARRRELAESERWILSNDRSWPYSFLNVCESLGIEPLPLRRELIRRCSTRGLAPAASTRRSFVEGPRRAGPM